jgi:hypothetical protein
MSQTMSFDMCGIRLRMKYRLAPTRLAMFTFHRWTAEVFHRGPFPQKFRLVVNTEGRSFLSRELFQSGFTMLRIVPGSRLPLVWLGVPTQTKAPFRLADRLAWIAGGVQSAGVGSCCDDFSDICFNDGRLPAVAQSDLCRNRADSNDFMSIIGEQPAEAVPTYPSRGC